MLPEAPSSMVSVTAFPKPSKPTIFQPRRREGSYRLGKMATDDMRYWRSVSIATPLTGRDYARKRPVLPVFLFCLPHGRRCWKDGAVAGVELPRSTPAGSGQFTADGTQTECQLSGVASVLWTASMRRIIAHRTRPLNISLGLDRAAIALGTRRRITGHVAPDWLRTEHQGAAT